MLKKYLTTYYTSSNLAGNETNETFVIPYIRPSETFNLMINVTADSGCISNGTRVYNNVTIRSNELSEQTFSEYLSYGGLTERIRITYQTSLTDVSSYGDTLISVIGILLVISAILLIVGIMYRYGYFGRGGQ